MNKTGSAALFQSQLNKSINENKESSEFFIQIEINSVYWLIDVKSLKEVSVSPKIARIGRSMSGIKGLGAFKGKVCALIDLVDLFSNGESKIQDVSWALVIRTKEESGGLALLCKSLKHMTPKNWWIKDPLVPLPNFAKGVWKKDNQCAFELDLNKVLPGSGFEGEKNEQ